MVLTNMVDTSEHRAWLWPGTRLRIARVLVDADGPLPGSAVASTLSMDTSNVNKELVALEKVGLISIRRPYPEEPTGFGRPSRYWILDPDQRQSAEMALSEQPEPQRPARRTRTPAAQTNDAPKHDMSVGEADDDGPAAPLPVTECFGRGAELVIADVADSRVIDLMAVLADAEAQVRPAWAALCGDELVFAFSDATATGEALDLMAILKAPTNGRVRRATVAQMWPGDRFIRQSGFSTKKARDVSRPDSGT
jgi:hypothetical protein